jgi:bifunctional ADP-heptose synthase (sugar kinase/adenylyltransferase)
MRKLIVTLAVLFAAAASASAQESYSTPATAQQVTDLTEGIGSFNVKTCKRLILAVGCTQAQACVAANAAGGASCTAAQASATVPSCRIYVTTTQAGREEFVNKVFVAPQFNDLKAVTPAINQYRGCLKWQTDNQTARDGSCTAAGITPPCTLYGTTCG